MKYEIVISEDMDGLEVHEIALYNAEGKWVGGHVVRALCECPEDAIIGRDLLDGRQVKKWLLMAYEAGKRGEILECVDKLEGEE